MEKKAARHPVFLFLVALMFLHTLPTARGGLLDSTQKFGARVAPGGQLTLSESHKKTRNWVTKEALKCILDQIRKIQLERLLGSTDVGNRCASQLGNCQCTKQQCLITNQCFDWAEQCAKECVERRVPFPP